MPFQRLVAFCNRKLDEVFPRPWLEEWQQAHYEGWQPDEANVYCNRCGSTIHASAQLPRGCAFCLHQRFPWRSITRLSAYDSRMAKWIHQLKFQRQWQWASLLGKELAWRLPAMTSQSVICPVPLHAWRRIKRGYNQSQLIAEAIAREHAMTVVNLLHKSRYTPAQSALSMSARLANLRQAFDMPPVNLTGLHIWLVNDVKTTGATLRACARLLRLAGAGRIDVAVLAVADPKGANFSTT